MKEDFKAGDILICKKAIDSEHQFVPRIQMIRGTEYRVNEVLARYISIVMNSTAKAGVFTSNEYFSNGEGIENKFPSLPYTDKRSYSAWDKWFYTKSEIREMKFKNLGI